MAKLSEYKTIEEKEKYFRNGNIKVVVNVEKIFEEIEKLNNGDFVFRGISEAKYKMFNSAQRYYIQTELYKQAHNKWESHYNSFIDKLIEECKNWNQSTVKKLLKASGISEDNSLAYLSVMQHFGTPTPLLDFTFNPYKALFFAIDNVHYSPSDNEIDNYFSFYYNYHNATIFEGWRHAFTKATSDLKAGNNPYSEVAKNWMHVLLPTDEAYQILNNTNIINQEGLFFYNNDPFKPMEEIYFEFAESVKGQFGQEKFDEMLMHETFANCFNIHKSLAPYIKEILASKGITMDFMYPDVNKMKNSILDAASINSLTLRK